MVKLSEVVSRIVSIDTEVVDGKTVIKQRYADGSYAIDTEYDGMEVHYPDNTVRVFTRVSDAKDSQNEADNYYLAQEKFADGTEIAYHENGVVSSRKTLDGVISLYNVNEKLKTEIFPDGSRKEYDTYVKETIRSILIGSYHSGKGAMYLKVGRYLKEEVLPNGDKKTYYPSGKLESFATKDGLAEQTWYKNGVKKYEKNPDGSCKCWNDDGLLMYECRADKTVIDYKYDNRGNLIYHAVNGKEDTIKYLAMKKVAERQVAKGEKLRAQNQGVENAPQTVKKLNVVQKAVQMAKARRDVKRELRGR